VIWGINSFDQWGVELGKQLANRLLPAINSSDGNVSQLDHSTAGLIAYFRRHGYD
jgi:glucose-6-phosphate isomerase